MERIVHSGAMSPAVFAQASAADDEEIRGLLRAVPMNGTMKIGFSREPSYFACSAPAGIAEETLLARRDGALISVGAWSVRDVWLYGEQARVGYLQGLRMKAGSMRILRGGYAELAERVAAIPVAGWFTSVDADNARARRIFESRASGLPRYRKIADYLTRVAPVPRRGAVVNNMGVESRDELTDFLQRESSRHDLALTWDDARWRGLERSGFTADDIVAVRRAGRIVAAAGLWDQSAWKQVIVHGYPRWLKPVMRVGAACLGLPRLPHEGACVPLASVFPFAVAEDCEGVMSELWRGVETMARARGIEWLTLGLDATDPLWQRIRRVGISYRTILFSVGCGGFPERWLESGVRMFRPECATL